MDPAAGEADTRMPALLQHVATAKPGDGKKPLQPPSLAHPNAVLLIGAALPQRSRYTEKSRV